MQRLIRYSDKGALRCVLEVDGSSTMLEQIVLCAYYHVTPSSTPQASQIAYPRRTIHGSITHPSLHSTARSLLRYALVRVLSAYQGLINQQLHPKWSRTTVLTPSRQYHRVREHTTHLPVVACLPQPLLQSIFRRSCRTPTAVRGVGVVRKLNIQGGGCSDT